MGNGKINLSFWDKYSFVFLFSNSLYFYTKIKTLISVTYVLMYIFNFILNNEYIQIHFNNNLLIIILIVREKLVKLYFIFYVL